MEKFTASNGLTVTLDHGGIEVNNPADPFGFGVVGDVVQALREFFVAERDEELGRERDTNYAIYPSRSGRSIRIVYELTGRSWDYPRDPRNWPHGGPSLIASTWWRKHPEPEPWHDAKDGQLWLIRFDDFPNTDVSALVKDGQFIYNDHCCEGVAALTDASIVAGRRVWPEVSGE